MNANERLATAVARVKAWMTANEAPLLVENLAPGATEAELDQAEKDFGFTLPPQLRALWAIHHGQLEEQNGFYRHMDLLSAQAAAAEADSVQMFLEHVREHPDDWERAGLKEEEVRSDAWVAFAGRGYADLLVISGVSGRVFWCGKDAPALQHRAATLVELFEQYADGVARDDYEVEEGFGDYFLAERDREAERQQAAAEAKRAAAEKYKRETPVLDRLQAALTKKDDRGCRDLVEEAAKQGKLKEAVDALFSGTSDDELLATALQFVLGQVTLTPKQWKQVAKGGAKLGNNAIREHAEARAK